MERISPRVDIAFKKIFGVEENKDLLISLINSIVSTQDQITDVTLLNPYNAKSFKTDKLSILDVKAKGADGKRFNIEIQITVIENLVKPYVITSELTLAYQTMAADIKEEHEAYEWIEGLVSDAFN